eukprot:gene20890-22741_t
MMQTLMNNSVVVLALALVMLALESSAFVVPTDDTYTNDYGFDYTTTVVKSAVGLYIGIVCGVLFCCIGLPILIFCFICKSSADATNQRNANAAAAKGPGAI